MAPTIFGIINQQELSCSFKTYLRGLLNIDFCSQWRLGFPPSPYPYTCPLGEPGNEATYTHASDCDFVEARGRGWRAGGMPP